MGNFRPASDLIEKTRNKRIRTFLWWLACIVGITLVLYWRRPDAFYNPQLWAEDGEVFFTQAFFEGIKPMVKPYRGYFHALGRVVAWIGSWLPVRYAPHWYEFAAWGMLVFISGYLFSARFPFKNALKFLLGLTLVSTTADNEVFFNVANWVTVTSFLWLLLAISNAPQSRLQVIFDTTVLILVGLSSPFVICLWPIFLLRWATQRTSHNLRLLGLSLIVATIQFWNMPARAGVGALSIKISPLLADILISHFGFMFLGEQISQLQLNDVLRIYGVISMAGFLGGLTWHAIKTRNWPMLTILSGGILATTLSIYVMREHNPAIMMYWSGRHFFIPAVIVPWALLLSKIKPRYLKWIPLTMIYAAFVFLTPGNKAQVFPDLDWAGHVSLCTGTQPLCKIPINPVWDPPRWFAYMDSHVIAMPTLQNAFSSRFGSTIELLGYDVEQTPSEVALDLIWRARDSMKTDYKYFVHLYDPNDSAKIIVQADMMPLAWQYPTSKWVSREIVSDSVVLPLTILQPGQYKVAVGWYDPNLPNLDRLPAYNDEEQNWPDNRVILPLTVVIP
ncbi:MAG: hypothetical protein JXA21_25790 [Anaerolineae bacterium]|nr:hypothetical protein [Anaerolineae bacterium]